jgi:hypothetical protein
VLHSLLFGPRIDRVACTNLSAFLANAMRASSWRKEKEKIASS